MYKRLYWAGYNGAFMGVTWDGSQTFPEMSNQVPFLGKLLRYAPGNVNNFNPNVENAFQTGQAIADLLYDLRANHRWDRVSVITHSLGATAVGQALHDLATRPTNRAWNQQEPVLHRVIHMQAAQSYNVYAPLSQQAGDYSTVDNFQLLVRGPWKGIFRHPAGNGDAPRMPVVGAVVNTYSSSDGALNKLFAANENALIKLIAVIVSVPQRPFNDWGRSAYAWTWATNQYPAMGLRPAEGLGDAYNFDAQVARKTITMPDGKRRRVYPGVWKHTDWRDKEYPLLRDNLYQRIYQELQ
jgi:hypothetical protein